MDNYDSLNCFECGNIPVNCTCENKNDDDKNINNEKEVLK